MHYFIDGYNLLFRLKDPHGNLQPHREEIISEINKMVSLVGINVTIVFDATFQEGERVRTHYNAVEIIYSAERETADDLIIDEIRNSPHPNKETVVTSDKRFASKIRFQTNIMDVSEFYSWLHRSYKNKLKKIKNPPIYPKKKVLLKSAESTPPETVPLLETHPSYEKIFESRYAELLVEEKEKKEIRNQKKKKKKKLSKEKPLPKKIMTDFERWLNAFDS